MKFCPECGAALFTQKFCQECGADISKYLNENREKSIVFDFSAIEDEAKMQLEEQKFDIDNGILKKYKGREEHVVIPEKVTHIFNGAFYKCQKVKKVSIPDSVISIGFGAFSECENLMSITIPDSVTSIGEQAFANCRSLLNVAIPGGVGIPNLHPLKNNGVF